jgi:predicted HD phosphohydrolase
MMDQRSPGTSALCAFTVEDLLAMLSTGSGVSYDAENVDELEHSLQCAHLAVSDQAAPEGIIAALLHDIGRTAVARRLLPPAPHEVTGGDLVSALFGEKAGWLVRQHVPAKRYLVATDPSYSGRLSPASVRSLEKQGGPLNRTEVLAFASHPWANDAIRLRRWDEDAKVAGAVVPPLASYRDLLETSFLTAKTSH